MDSVIRKLWEPSSQIYHKKFQAAMQMTALELSDNLKDIVMPYYASELFHVNYIITNGCSRHICDGDFSGCSMCSLHSEKIYEPNLQALSIKDKRLYAQAVKKMFVNARGYVKERSYHEIFLSHSFFDDKEITSETWDVLFGDSPIFQKRPFLYEFEIHAEDVTQDKIDKMKQAIGSTGLSVRIGIECQSEWIRKYWLNKPISNQSILKAIRLCRKNGISVTANLLLGLPGLTEMQSSHEFVQSIKWLNPHVDRFCVSFLNRTGISLHNYIYQNLADNQILLQEGLCQGKHTGIPWLFTIVNSLFHAHQQVPDFFSRLTIGQFDPSAKSTDPITFYNHSAGCSCFAKTYDALKSFIFLKDFTQLEQLYYDLPDDQCFPAYQKLITKQKGYGEILQTAQIVGTEVAKKIWHGDSDYINNRIAALQHDIEFNYKQPEQDGINEIYID